MSAGTTSTLGDPLGSVEPGARRRRRRWVISTVVVVVAAAAVIVLVGDVFTGGGGTAGVATTNGFATALATVQRRSLSTQTQLNGTLGYAGSYTVLDHRHGTVTWLPKPGQVVRQGQVVYRVDDQPTVLLYGSTPAYRSLALDLTGPDVAQLNHDLVALGYLPRAEADAAWDEFSLATRTGVAKLQQHLGVTQSGVLSRGGVVFLPTAARVTALRASLGGPAGGPVLSATTTRPTVTVALDPSLRSQVKDGGRVTVTLPQGGTIPGRVTSVSRVATVTSPDSADGGGGEANGPTVAVTIQPTHPAAIGGLDQAAVEVSITDQTVHNVLAVPVDALLARGGGGYAVEVVGPDTSHHLVGVQPGLFDDATGSVQVSGPGLAAGQHVVVPGNE